MLKIKIVSIVLIVSLVASFLSFSGVVASDNDFTYEVFNGVATITGYAGPGGDVVIPSSLGGYSVREIGYGSFSDKTNITSVVIPEGVTAIDMWAFSSCSNLTRIVIPDSVKSIGYRAFYGCNSLAYHTRRKTPTLMWVI